MAMQAEKSNQGVNPQATSGKSVSLPPPPQYWCSLTYYEQDTQVGETFKVSSAFPKITIDGSKNTSTGNKFCLGTLSNESRTEEIETVRNRIDTGVELELRGEGDVWLKCLSNHSVYVTSFYLDREAGRSAGDGVHKIYPCACIKIFDMKQLEDMIEINMEMLKKAIGASGAAFGPGLRRWCILKMSFGKGWGPDYSNKTVNETPCWIEIQLHRGLELLDEALHIMSHGAPATE